jgi:hypothetical protein
MGKNKNKFSGLSFIIPNEDQEEEVYSNEVDLKVGSNDEVSAEEYLEEDGDEEDGDEEDGEEDGDEEGGDQLESKILSYHQLIKKEMPLLSKEIQSNSNLTKNTIKLFLSILDRCYDLINEITILMKREGIEDRSQKIFDLDKKLNPIYIIIDKYREHICSEVGVRRLNRLDFLNEVDIYYNLFICTGCPKYILSALEFSSWETLQIVDYLFYKTGKRNERRRFQTYLSILCIKQKKIPDLLSERDIRSLTRICGKNKIMENEYKKLFDLEFEK